MLLGGRGIGTAFSASPALILGFQALCLVYCTFIFKQCSPMLPMEEFCGSPSHCGILWHTSRGDAPHLKLPALPPFCTHCPPRSIWEVFKYHIQFSAKAGSDVFRYSECFARGKQCVWKVLHTHSWWEASLLEACPKIPQWLKLPLLSYILSV